MFFNNVKYFSTIVGILVALGLLSACATPVEPLVVEKEIVVTAPPEEQAQAELDEFEKALAFVRENLPAQSYMTNRYLPKDPYVPWIPWECEQLTPIVVGEGWIQNDEHGPWFIAHKKGWYKDRCLIVTLEPGGPGKNHLEIMAGGGDTDIAVVAGGSDVPKLVGSPTPADVVVIGAFYKWSPYGWLTLDPDTPQDQHSTLVRQPEDFVGNVVGIQPDSEYLINYVIGKYGLPADSIEAAPGGFTPDPLILGKWFGYGAWVMNQARLLEEKGYYNWSFYSFAKQVGFGSYSDVSVVTRKMLEEQPDVVRGYLDATYRGLVFMLEHPEESTDIIMEYAYEGMDFADKRAAIVRRLELQRDYIIGGDGLMLMHMSKEQWDNHVARLYQYGQIAIAPK